MFTLLETAFSSRYADPEKYQDYVVSMGREALAQEVATVVSLKSKRKPKAKRRVLDVAAGTGLVSNALLDAGCSVVAFDHSAAMLATLQQQFPQITTVTGDMNHPWPFSDNSFDAVTIVWGNRYISDPVHFTREALRVLRPGGVLAWPIFWLETPLWWFFSLKSLGITQLFSVFKFTVGGVEKTLRSNSFVSVHDQSSQLGHKVSFWQKPIYVVGFKPKD